MWINAGLIEIDVITEFDVVLDFTPSRDLTLRLKPN
jgi:hypothetical protein